MPSLLHYRASERMHLSAGCSPNGLATVAVWNAWTSQSSGLPEFMPRRHRRRQTVVRARTVRRSGPHRSTSSRARRARRPRTSTRPDLAALPEGQCTPRPVTAAARAGRPYGRTRGSALVSGADRTCGAQEQGRAAMAARPCSVEVRPGRSTSAGPFLNSVTSGVVPGWAASPYVSQFVGDQGCSQGAATPNRRSRGTRPGCAPRADSGAACPARLPGGAVVQVLVQA